MNGASFGTITLEELDLKKVDHFKQYLYLQLRTCMFAEAIEDQLLMHYCVVDRRQAVLRRLEWVKVHMASNNANVRDRQTTDVLIERWSLAIANYQFWSGGVSHGKDPEGPAPRN